MEPLRPSMVVLLAAVVANFQMAAAAMALIVTLDEMLDDEETMDLIAHQAIVAASSWIISQPSMLRRLDFGRMPRRLWSTRALSSNKEVSSGVWEVQIEETATRLRSLGYVDYSDKYYIALFRMCKRAFDDLYDAVGVHMGRSDTNYRAAVPGKKRLAIFLAWLAHGHKQSQLALLFHVSQPLVSGVINVGLAVFIQHFVASQIVLPRGQAVLDVSHGFQQMAGLPGCVGAVDGTFFHIHMPSRFGEAYWCYKRIYAMLLLAACDSNMIFTWVSTGNPGSVGDAHVRNNSDYKRMLLSGMFDAPLGPANQHQLVIEGRHVKSYVVADAAFALSARVIKCYDPCVTAVQEGMNNAIILTRRIIENAFGHLKGRWNICIFNRCNKPDRAAKIALVCCALHNFCERAQQHYDLGWDRVVFQRQADLDAYRAARARYSSGSNASAGPDAHVVREKLAKRVAIFWYLAVLVVMLPDASAMIRGATSLNSFRAYEQSQGVGFLL